MKRVVVVTVVVVGSEADPHVKALGVLPDIDDQITSGHPYP